MTIKHIPEQDLVARLSNSDEAAFREVFDRFHREIYQYAFAFLKEKEQSEEIVQDTFLRFWLHRETLDVQKPIAPLLFVIARRTLTDAWRKAATSEKFRQYIHQYLAYETNETEEAILLNDLARMTQEALEQLTEQQREVFKLSRNEGLSHEEVSDRLNISKHTVKYHLVNALKVIRAHFTKHDVLCLYFLHILLLK